ncbi:MAG: site-2 protease family protein [Chloroflexi bacterium]|nr:site-2 protease family protein [Chloroflexota bacterium]
MRRYSPGQIITLILIGLAILYYVQPGIFRNPGQLGANVPGQVLNLLITVIAIVLAITVHEANHALVAVLLGDPTPKLMGRLSLNPIRHLDPIGTILMFVAHFGWGKPVMFNPGNLRVNPHLGSAAVSFAGPLANIVFAGIIYWALVLFRPPLDPNMTRLVENLLIFNVVLAAFNLVPIPPLDGFGVVYGILPRQLAVLLDPVRQYGWLILLLAVFLPSMGGPDLISPIREPIQRAITRLITGRGL